jgi:hypothetical protein
MKFDKFMNMVTKINTKIKQGLKSKHGTRGLNKKELILFKLVSGGISFYQVITGCLQLVDSHLWALLHRKAQGEPYHKPKYVEHKAIREGWILCLLFRSGRDLTPMLHHLRVLPMKKPEVKLIISLKTRSTKQ